MNNNIFDRIIAEIESGNFRSAIYYCDEILNEFPDNRSVYEIRSGCHYAIGDYESAINDLTYSIVKLKSGANTTEEIIGLYGKRGKIYLKRSDWQKASEDYKKILILNQNNPEIQNSLAVCYRKMGNYTEALYHASQAIRLNGDYAEAYNNRANINISLEKYENAIIDYTKSINLNPLNANVYFNRGSIYCDVLNNKDKALQDFQKAIEIKPELKEEIEKHYPDIFNIPEAIKEESTPEIIIPVQGDTNIGFSLDEFDSLFKEKETKPAVNPFEDNVKQDDFKALDFSSVFEKKENSEPETSVPKFDEVNKTDDIIIPTFDLKSMFAELNESEEIPPLTEEQPSLPDKPVITDAIKLLHEEIQTVNEKEADSIVDVGGINFDSFEKFKNNESIPDKPEESNYYIPEEKEKGSFLRSPVFFIILIGLMGIIILLSVLKFFKSQENQIVNVQTEVKIDSNSTKSNDTVKAVTKDTAFKKETEKKDSIKTTEVKKEEPKKEEPKKEEPKKEETKKTPELTTKNLGYISDKKQFVLFSEPDGYYVQIGSYKEKSKADEKLRLLEKNKVKGKVSEVDLKEKGIFYRVRAGVFATPEEAKEKTLKIE